MAHALRRILRFRQLAEEQARLEVEQAAHALRQASAACERQIATEHRQRSTLAESWATGGADSSGPVASWRPIKEPVAENAWLLEEAALEFFGWNRMRLEQIREAKARCMEPMIERYKEHRRELLQTEQLLAQQTAIETMERDRRAQAETDEWFQQRSLANRRRVQQREHTSHRSPTTEEELQKKF